MPNTYNKNTSLIDGPLLSVEGLISVLILWCLMATDTFNIPLKQKLGIMRKVEFYGLD